MPGNEASTILSNAIIEVVITTANERITTDARMELLVEKLKNEKFPFNDAALMQELIPLAEKYEALFREESLKKKKDSVLMKRTAELFQGAVLMMKVSGIKGKTGSGRKKR